MTQENQVDQIATKFAELSSDQVRQFVENYAERIVEDMDTKTLMQFAYDVIVDNLDIQSPEDILNEVSCVYDEETVAELIESVTVD